MAVIDAKKAYKNLKKKGFVDSPSKSIDHKYLELYHNEKLVLYTKISHGEKELDDYLIKQMALQCKLNKQDFSDLANCSLSESDYLRILVENGYIKLT